MKAHLLFTSSIWFQVVNIMLKFYLILALPVYLVAGAPRPEDEDEYEEENACLTSADSEDPEKECIFPFTFNNFTYNGCPTDPVDETKRWCSTKTDENGIHITGNTTWGYCTPGCHPEVFPGNVFYLPCVVRGSSRKDF